MSVAETAGYWSQYNPVRIVAGVGALRRLPEFAPGGRLLLVTSAGFTRRGIVDYVRELLGRKRCVVYDQVAPNPELDVLDQLVARFRCPMPDGIIALGGGSVLDTGKVLGVTLRCGGSRPLHRVLRAGGNRAWRSRIPVLAIPTTAGTGAEVTPFATVWDKAVQKKYSISGELIFPTQALLDPKLTLSLPRNETLYPALDALSHALESLWNRNRTPLSEALALDALRFANQALPEVLARPADLTARARMQNASLLAGMAISQTRTALAHAFSYPLTAGFGMPHGLACGFALHSIWRACRPAPGDVLRAKPVREAIKLLAGLNLAREALRFVTLAKVQAALSLPLASEQTSNFALNLDAAAMDSIMARALEIKGLGRKTSAS